MTNKPMEAFTKAVEEALQQYAEYYIAETMKFFQENGESPALSKNNPGDTEALASIQAATADLLLELVGEDEDVAEAVPVSETWATMRSIRNDLRAELRQKIAGLRAEGGGDNE